jgi:PPM family protein phosphatase
MSSVNPDDRMKIVARTHVGMVRSNNEDYHGYSPNLTDEVWKYYDQSEIAPDYPPVVLALADGMGGLEMGEEASRIAIETTRDYVFQHKETLTDTGTDADPLFDRLFRKINDEILTFARKHGKAGETGTTLVISFLHRHRLDVYWIGDSRCYLFRGGKLIPVSKDHSYVQELVDQGKITYEQSFYHPESNIITQYMGDPKHTPVPSHATVTLRSGDIVLMCSDGLNGMVQDIEIEEHLGSGGSLDAICQSLIDHANSAGGDDNITVMLLSYGAGSGNLPEEVEEDLADTIRNSVRTISSGTQDAGRKRRRRGWLWFMVLLVISLAAFACYFFGYGGLSSIMKDREPPQEVVEPDSTRAGDVSAEDSIAI